MKAGTPVGEVLRWIEDLAPSGTAEEWDDTGLLLGDSSWQTPGAVVSIDLTEQSIQNAKRLGFRLIVTHHPCISSKNRGPFRLGPESLVFQAVREGIAVVACHTNFDQCALEVPEAISQGLGVELRGRFVEAPGKSLFKLTVFVPSSHEEAVRSAICEAGAGHVGEYDQCSFGVPGEGTFRGSDRTKPYLGQPGKLERAREVRIETVLPRGLARPVLAAMHAAHPYEEVAYDLIPVAQRPAKVGMTRGLGYGFWGEFKRPKSFPELARDVKKLFNVNGFWVSQPSPARIRRIGFVAGKGASFLEAAKATGCDVFITGEAGYHAVLASSRRGMAVMELGHRESEKFFLETMKGWLSSRGLRTMVSDVPTQVIWSGGTK